MVDPAVISHVVGPAVIVVLLFPICSGCPAVISDALSTLKEFAEELDQLDQQPLESSGQ